MTTTSSILSKLSCDTAEEFDDPTVGFIRFQMALNDVPLEGVRLRPGRTEFEFENFVFTVDQVNQAERRTVYFSVSAAPEYEWRLRAQMRIKSGHINASVLKVVDKDVFEFFPKCDPVTVEIMSSSIGVVKFELRVLNKVIEQLPSFNEGDLTVLFADSSTLQVHRDLVNLYSAYIKGCTDGSNVTFVEDFPKPAFIEMLYHIYPTLRPIYRNIREFAKGAVSYQAYPLIYQLTKHLVNYNTRSMSLEQKLKIALEMELGPAIEELVYRAAQDGVWTQLIKLGFEPESFFGQAVYKKLVCPAILAGRQNEIGKAYLPKPYVEPNFFSEEAMRDPSNVTILFRRTPFYVNKGLIEVHGTSKLAKSSEGVYHALFTREMEEECARGALLPGEVLVSLFTSMYPLGPAIPLQFLRAAIVFCHDHDWTHMKSKIEQDLLQQPPVSRDDYRDQILFAERFGLQNMLAVSIQRAEGSCNTFAEELRKSDDFERISSPTRDLVVDRLCSGWGLEPKHTNKLATREPSSFRERQIGLNCGGPRAYDEERQVATLAEMNSEYYFGPVGELCVVES